MADATLELYWRMVEARGDKPKPLYVVFDRSTGAVKTWSLDRREMTRWLKSLSFAETCYRLAKVTLA